MINILTKEQSEQLAKEAREQKLKFSIEEIINEAKFFQSLPEFGHTKYIVGKENWDNFFDWLTSKEAKEQWNIYTSILPLARYFGWKYIQGWSDEEIQKIIEQQIQITNANRNQD